MAIAAPPVNNELLHDISLSPLPMDQPLRAHKSPPEPPLLFKRMSWEEFMRLPEKPRVEWLDGTAVIRMAPGYWPHAYRMNRVGKVIDTAIPSLEVFIEAPVKLGREVFYPDVIVVEPATPDGNWVEKPPVIIVEVLSPSTRKYDLTVKSEAYLSAGVGQYWTVDNEIGEIVVRENAGDQWTELAKLDAEHPEITVTVGDYGSVTLSRNQLFG